MNIYTCPDADCPLHCSYTIEFAELTPEQELLAAERRRCLKMGIGVCMRNGGPRLKKPYEIRKLEKRAGIWSN